MDERIGQQYGNYRLIHLLGKGGFAEVYQGEHIFLKTSAAIKVLLQEHTRPEEHEAFLQEARTIAKLTHPHIVRLLDFGLQQTMPFLVMDYAPGGTLRGKHARGTRLSLDTVCEYARQVAEALQFAHGQHIIHRDIKPENMLIGMRDEILVGDFGIALAVQSSRAVSTQEVIGTTQYMAPEQILGKPHLASDQYALAIVVYEWLNGVAPFRGSFTEVCAQHIHAPLPPLQRSDLSPDVTQVLTKALAKTPEERFATISEFVAALAEIGKPTARREAPVLEPIRPTRPPAVPIVATGSAQPSPTPILTPPDATTARRQQQMMITPASGAAVTEDEAYHTLRQQVEASDATSQLEGAVVVRAPAALAGQVIYLQPTFWWRQQPGQQYMSSSEVRRQQVLGHSLTAAVFKNLKAQEYTIWTPQHNPVQTVIQPNQALLLDLSQITRIRTHDVTRAPTYSAYEDSAASPTSTNAAGVIALTMIGLAFLGWILGTNLGNGLAGIIIGGTLGLFFGGMSVGTRKR